MVALINHFLTYLLTYLLTVKSVVCLYVCVSVSVCLGIYSCPAYYYPRRTGTRERPSFIVAVDLRSGEKVSEHWTKRGTALLLSLDV